MSIFEGVMISHLNHLTINPKQKLPSKMCVISLPDVWVAIIQTTYSILYQFSFIRIAILTQWGRYLYLFSPRHSWSKSQIFRRTTEIFATSKPSKIRAPLFPRCCFRKPSRSINVSRTRPLVAVEVLTTQGKLKVRRGEEMSNGSIVSAKSYLHFEVAQWYTYGDV